MAPEIFFGRPGSLVLIFGFSSGIIAIMDLYQKIRILGPSAQYDTCGPKDFGNSTNIPGVYRANLGSGRICRLFKVLQTNSCANNCRYCAFRKDRDFRRVKVTSEEMAKSFILAYSRCLVEGLFLSSGLAGSADQVMAPMIDTALILRKKYRYQGYIHLKVMPGASANAIWAALSLANRVSINIEVPKQAFLKELSPEKNLATGFFPTLRLIRKAAIQKQAQGRRVSLTTQFVVGAGPESDRDIIESADRLYKNFGLSRVFYSAFRPVVRTPLENSSPTSLVREHRLYQADFLLRFYRFSPDEIPYNDHSFLRENQDPKTIWAQNNSCYFPLNVNKATFWQLLRVPGIGPIAARKIINLRKEKRLFSLDNLTGLRIQKKAYSFLVF